MARIRWFHWNQDEADDRASILRAAGHEVVAGPPGRTEVQRLGRKPPDAVVIDLSRLPAQGRDLALLLRSRKGTRRTPLVLVDGAADKVTRFKSNLPGAVFTSRSRVRGAVTRALAAPPQDVPPPTSVMAGYSGTPLVKKLMIKEGSKLALVGAPESFDRTLGKLPHGVRVRRRAGGTADVTVCFVKSVRDLERRLDRMAGTAGQGRFWIAWPKKTSGVKTDVTETIVRRTGLATGLVDFKICAIDDTWSGLCFTRRKSR